VDQSIETPKKNEERQFTINMEEEEHAILVLKNSAHTTAK